MRVHVVLIREKYRDPFLKWTLLDPCPDERIIATYEFPDDFAEDRVTAEIKARIFPLQFQAFAHGEWRHVEWSDGIVTGGYRLAGISEPLSELRIRFGPGYRLITADGHEIERVE